MLSSPLCKETRNRNTKGIDNYDFSWQKMVCHLSVWRELMTDWIMSTANVSDPSCLINMF